MEIDYEFKEFPEPKAGTLMTVVYREMLEHYNSEFKKLADEIIKAYRKDTAKVAENSSDDI